MNHLPAHGLCRDLLDVQRANQLWKWVQISIAACCCLFVAAAVLAQVSGTADITVNYTLPTKNTDGSNIPTTGLNSLSKARFYLSNSVVPADLSGLTPTLEAPIGTSAVVPGFSTSLGATIHVRMTVCNVAGVCSDPTNDFTGIVTAAKPGSPVFNSLTITIK